MGDLIYTGNTSLDGYTVDADGNFDWTTPDNEVFRYITDLEARVGTYLYGRRMYETMAVWDGPEFDDPGEIVGAGGQVVPVEPSALRRFAKVWRGADKVVFSRTLVPEAISTPRTRLVSNFDAESVRTMKAESNQPVSVGGPALAAAAIRSGLVDQLHRFVFPVVIGGGTPFLPTGVLLDLELLDEHRFASGVVHLHYRVLNGASAAATGAVPDAAKAPALAQAAAPAPGKRPAAAPAPRKSPAPTPTPSPSATPTSERAESS